MREVITLGGGVSEGGRRLHATPLCMHTSLRVVLYAHKQPTLARIGSPTCADVHAPSIYLYQRTSPEPVPSVFRRRRLELTWHQIRIEAALSKASNVTRGTFIDPCKSLPACLCPPDIPWESGTARPKSWNLPKVVTYNESPENWGAKPAVYR